MSTQMKQTIFMGGSAPSTPGFREHAERGDWERWSIQFPTPFPTNDVRVIVTANNKEVVAGEHNAAVVGIANDVNAAGFTLTARNSDSAPGRAGFNWMAVCETPGKDQKTYVLRMGMVQPKSFEKEGVPGGDWRQWMVKFTAIPPKPSTAVLTENNLNVPRRNPACVGIVQDLTMNGFTLAARNSDTDPGACAFYYVALSEEPGGKPDLWIDTGVEDPKTFQPEGDSGDWQEWEIYFHKPFLTPPVVLVTPNRNAGMKGDAPAPVGIAQNVTTHGFNLAARNSASGDPDQVAGFNWVAIGCAQFCTG